jgi:hypothetical protein
MPRERDDIEGIMLVSSLGTQATTLATMHSNNITPDVTLPHQHKELTMLAMLPLSKNQ